MLACCNAARIWKDTCFGVDFLEKNVICITFGQPLLANPYVLEVIQKYPTLEKNIHSVHDSEDMFPMLLRYYGFVSYDKDKAKKVPSSMKALTSNGNGHRKVPSESSQLPSVSIYYKNFFAMI